MRFDTATHEGLILLGGDKRKGLWASSTILKSSKTVRQAGQLPTSASGHTLELVALASALRSISNSQVSFLMQNAPSSVTKPRLLIMSADKTRDAVTLAAKPLKAGRNFLSMVAREIGRFELTLQTDIGEDQSIANLSIWAHERILSPKTVGSIAQALRPTAISQLL